MSAVTLRGVTRRFNAKTAVNAIDLEIPAGQFVTLLGPSGCGKTTTLRMTAGLEQADAGTITIGGRVVNDAAAGVFVPPEKRELGMVFQSYAIWPHMTVFDNVAYPLRIRGRSRHEIKQRVSAALRLVEMDEFSDRPAPALSGGQQQRVAIARAIVFEPTVLLLDEPLSNLDARLRLQMGAEFRALQRRLGITTLYVTHDQDEAMALSDLVVVMSAGSILQIGAPEDLYSCPSTCEVARFFGAPNLLTAKVTACKAVSDSRFELEVAGPNWSAVCHSGEAFDADDEVSVMVRPENLRLMKANGDIAKNSWRGTVVRSTFRGASRIVEVESSGTTLYLETPGNLPQPEGNVSVTTDDRSLWALRSSAVQERPDT